MLNTHTHTHTHTINGINNQLSNYFIEPKSTFSFTENVDFFDDTYSRTIFLRHLTSLFYVKFFSCCGSFFNDIKTQKYTPRLIKIILLVIGSFSRVIRLFIQRVRGFLDKYKYSLRDENITSDQIKKKILCNYFFYEDGSFLTKIKLIKIFKL